MTLFSNDLALAKAYQKGLIFAALEDFSAVDVMGDIHGGQFGASPDAWRKAVADFIYRNMAGGLLQIKSGFDIVPPEITPTEFHKLLLTTNPEDDTLLWMGLQFTATKSLVELIRRVELLDWNAYESELNGELIASIEPIYSAQLQTPTSLAPPTAPSAPSL